MTDQDYNSEIITQMRERFEMNLDNGGLKPIQFPHELVEYSLSRIGEEPTLQVLDYISEHTPGASGQGKDLVISERLNLLFGATLGTIDILADDCKFTLPEEVFDEHSLDEIRGYSFNSNLDETRFDSVYAFVAEEDEKDKMVESLKEKKRNDTFMRTASNHGWDTAIAQSQMN